MNSNLQNLDLLTVFDALWLERSVTKAARRLGLSQPGLSHSLSRLRLQFKDELFVRSRQGVVPTPRAIALHKDVESFIECAHRIYQRDEPSFQSFSGRIRIATTDYFEHMVMPKLLHKTSVEIPAMQIICRPTHGNLPHAEMERGEIDFSIAGFFGTLPEGLLSQVLYEESYCCLVRKGNPIFKNGMNLDSFLKAQHILVSPHGDLEGAMDLALKKKKLSRKTVAGLSGFHSVPYIIGQTDFVATFPARMGRNLAAAFNLDLFEPPLPVAEYSLKNIWHARTNSSPIHKWLRKIIKEICTEEIVKVGY